MSMRRTQTAQGSNNELRAGKFSFGAEAVQLIAFDNATFEATGSSSHLLYQGVLARPSHALLSGVQKDPVSSWLGLPQAPGQLAVSSRAGCPALDAPAEHQGEVHADIKPIFYIYHLIWSLNDKRTQLRATHPIHNRISHILPRTQHAPATKTHKEHGIDVTTGMAAGLRHADSTRVEGGEESSEKGNTCGIARRCWPAFICTAINPIRDSR